MRHARWLPKAIVAAVLAAVGAYALLLRVTMPGARRAMLWIVLLQREHVTRGMAALSCVIMSHTIEVTCRHHKQQQQWIDRAR